MVLIKVDSQIINFLNNPYAAQPLLNVPAYTVVSLLKRRKIRFSFRFKLWTFWEFKSIQDYLSIKRIKWKPVLITNYCLYCNYYHIPWLSLFATSFFPKTFIPMEHPPLRIFFPITTLVQFSTGLPTSSLVMAPTF